MLPFILIAMALQPLDYGSWRFWRDRRHLRNPRTQFRGIQVQFVSPTAGLARLTDVPLIELTITVDKPHVISVFTDEGSTFFKDLKGTVHLLTTNAVQPGAIATGGTLSVENVTPGGGLLPAGTRLDIPGTGFTSATSVTIDGVSVGAPQFVSPSLMQITLAAPIELTGKHVHVQNPDGQQVDYWPWLQNLEIVQPPAGASGIGGAVLPIFPLISVTAANLTWEIIPSWSHWIAIQNPNGTDTDVTIGCGTGSVTVPGLTALVGIYAVISAAPPSVSPATRSLAAPRFALSITTSRMRASRRCWNFPVTRPSYP